MATKTKRWVVRDDGEFTSYIIVVGHTLPVKQGRQWIGLGEYPHWMEHKQFEHIFPHRLPEGGGPLEMRFADEE